jgi:hypothetical protein
MGWVSILTPGRINKVLDVPETWRLLGYFCLGYPQSESDTPELERAGWERRHAPEMFILRRAKIRHVAGDVARSFFTAFFSAKTARSTVARGQWGAPRSSPPAARPEVDRHGAAAASWNQLGHCHRGPSAAAVDCGSVRVSVRYLPAVSAHAVDDRVLRAIQGRHAGLCGPRE